MTMLNKATITIDGVVIKPKMGVTYTGEDDQAEGIVTDEGIEYRDKANIPGFIIDYVPTQGNTEPDWKSWNGKLAVIQEDGGARRAYSEIRFKGIGNFKLAREGGDNSKPVEFMAKKMVRTD